MCGVKVIGVKTLSNDIKEAIILAGGNSWRLKPDIFIPKPMLKLNKWTLLEYQIRWLMSNKFNHIIIASDDEYKIHYSLQDFVDWSVTGKKGTGGDVLVASDYLKTDRFYLLNVDDIVWFNPNMLRLPEVEARILVSKPRIGYGRVEVRKDLVLGFKEKPYLDFWVSVGHYFFKKHIVDRYFPDYGNLEDSVLSELSRRRKLHAYKLRGKWVTINTMKDYLLVKEMVGSE